MKEKTEYRAYFFVHSYLSSLQAGLQSAHCLSEMFIKYANWNPPSYDILLNWAYNYKTIIILSGGNCENLMNIYGDISTISDADDLDLPIGFFAEDKKSLNEAWTCTGVILPHTVYDLDLNGSYVDQDLNIVHPSSERQLKEIISKYKLAH